MTQTTRLVLYLPIVEVPLLEGAGEVLTIPEVADPEAPLIQNQEYDKRLFNS
jgi:hypothetical protein